jgi:hypothetical protein
MLPNGSHFLAGTGAEPLELPARPLPRPPHVCALLYLAACPGASTGLFFLARHHRSFELASKGGTSLASGAAGLDWELWTVAMLRVLVLGPASQKFQPRLKTEDLAWRGVDDIADLVNSSILSKLSSI